MADPNIQNILAALAAQNQSGTPPQAGPPPQIPATQYPAAQYTSPPGSVAPYGLPQPISSGSVDLGGIKPVSSGSVSIADALAKAKGFAAEKGISYDPRSASRNDSRRDYRRSRSPTPPRGRDNYRDSYNPNPYRDERRSNHDRHARNRSNSPRNRYGSPGYGDGSPGRDKGGEPDSEIVPIEKSFVGLIIGRNGENLKRVEGQTGARVQFVDGPDTAGTQRHCKVSGSRAARASAKAEIFKIIEDNEMSKRGGDRSKSTPKPNAPITQEQEDDSLQIMVPDRTVGLIIGRGGETIRDLQERSGCHVNITAENKSINGYRPVNLIGSPASQKHAQELIFEIVESDQKGISIKDLHNRREDSLGGMGGGGMGGGAGGAGGSKINDSIMVPGEAVGMIIGKGGETIREMQNSTGCKINVSPPSGRDVEREIGLIGTRGAIEAAKRAIRDKVDSAISRGRVSGGDQRGVYGDQYGGQQQQPMTYPPAGGAPPAQAAAGAGGADPYAAYGGYNNYVQMWYAAMAAQQQPGGQGEQR